MSNETNLICLEGALLQVSGCVLGKRVYLNSTQLLQVIMATQSFYVFPTRHPSITIALSISKLFHKHKKSCAHNFQVSHL